MSVGRTQTFSMCIRITLKFSFFPLSVPFFREHHHPESRDYTRRTQQVGKGRAGPMEELWGSWGRVLLGPNMKTGMSGTIAMETGAEERGSKWEQEMISY